MRVLYIAEEELAPREGVRQKIFGQAAAFAAGGFDAWVLYRHHGVLRLRHVAPPEDTALGPLRDRQCWWGGYYAPAHRVIAQVRPDAIYLRAFFTEPLYLLFLRRLKARGIRLVVEYPTYPYDGEYRAKPFFKRHLLLVDRWCRTQLRRYVDYAVTYTEDGDVFGMRTIKIENGVALDAIPVRRLRPSGTAPRLMLVGIARVTPSHGYDRVIEGLRRYRQERADGSDVHFHIVGDGPAGAALRRQAQAAALEAGVHFHPAQTGPALDALCDGADVGVGPLGMHRVGLRSGAALKIRDYCARGLPFILGYDDADARALAAYAYQAPADDSPLDIADVVRFHARVSREDCRPPLRRYAETRLSWTVKMAPVMAALRRA